MNTVAHKATAMIGLLADPALFKAIIQLLAAWTHNFLDGVLQCGLNFSPPFSVKKLQEKNIALQTPSIKKWGRVN